MLLLKVRDLLLVMMKLEVVLIIFLMVVSNNIFNGSADNPPRTGSGFFTNHHVINRGARDNLFLFYI